MSSGFWTFFMVMLISMAATELQDFTVRNRRNPKLKAKKAYNKRKKYELSARSP